MYISRQVYGSSYGDLDTTACVVQPKDMPARDCTLAESILVGKRASRDARRAARQAQQASHGQKEDVPERGSYDGDWPDAVDHLMSQDSPRAPVANEAQPFMVPDQVAELARASSRSHTVNFSHMPLKQKHVEKIFGIAYRAGLTSDLVKEVEVILTEIMDSREDGQLSIQDLLDALSEFMELDYSCADLSTRPKMLPKFIGLAPHFADVVEDADLAPEHSPSSPRHDGHNGHASPGGPGHALAKRSPTAALGSEGSGEDESSDDEGQPGEDNGRSGEDESGEDNELSDDEDEEPTGDVDDDEPSDDDDDDTSEDEDPRGPRQVSAEPVEEVGLE